MTRLLMNAHEFKAYNYRKKVHEISNEDDTHTVQRG